MTMIHHTYPGCGCRLCGSSVIDAATDTGEEPRTMDDLIHLLADVATLAKMDSALRDRVEVMLRDLTRGRS